jgi:hypothetical protein
MIVILEVPGQEPHEMSLVQDDYVVQAFATDTPETTRLRSWARMSSTKSTLWVTVGTTKKARATKSCT